MSDVESQTYQSSDRLQVCAFWIGDHYCGLHLDCVEEVAQRLIVRFIPLAPKKVEGLALLRGNIINAINGRVCMGLDPPPSETSFSYIVIKRGEETVAIGVDRVEDIVEVSPEQFSSAPSTLPPHQQSLVDGAYLLEKRLLVMLNANELTKIPPVTLSYTPPPILKKRNKKTDKAEQTMALAK